LKVPLEHPQFVLEWGVILTKDILTKWKWNGSKKCMLCDCEEMIRHLRFSCPSTILLWETVHLAFNLPPPTSIQNISWNWLTGVSKLVKAHIHVWVSVLYWLIWNCCKDTVFNKAKYFNCLHVLHNTVY
jgi:hypothetical protein